ncbi:MAG: serine protease [Alphaproteobacteria bacterium]|jgi:hypothetical protein|nr:serine protease [Alphaproteobacteria bacterium]
MVSLILARPRAAFAGTRRALTAALFIVGFASAALAQPSTTLAQKSGEAGEIAAIAQQQGYARVIVQFQAPVALSAGRPDAAAIANVTAQVSSVQDSIITTHFGSPSAPAEGQGFVRGISRFAITPGFAVNVTLAELEALAADPRILHIQYDRPVPPTLNQSVPLIGMPAAYAAGATGTGQTVAILDTGIKAHHEFLEGKVIAEACFSNAGGGGGKVSLCPNGTPSQTGAGAADANTAQCNNAATTSNTLNLCFHGTHVAGIAAGNNTSLTAPEPNGVAKLSNIFAIQVFTRFNGAQDCSGAASCVAAFPSDIINALDYVYANLTPGGVPVASVNMSLGGGSFSGTCDSDARKPVIDNLRAAGVLTTISAGNSSTTSLIGAPACISSAVTVGATSKADAIASYSSMSGVVDLLAPGGDSGSMTCTFPPNTFIVSSAASNSLSTTAYTCAAGTSMAAPHVAGAIAAIKSACPAATADQIEAALISTGLPITDTRPACPGGAGCPVGLTRPAGSQTKNRIRVDQAVTAACGGGPLMTVSPSSHILASGPASGPFSPNSFVYTLTASTGTLNWSITGTPSWLDVSAGSGTAGTGGTTVTFTVNANANAFPLSVQGPTTITFTNTTNGFGTQTRTATLNVTPANDNFANAITLSPAGQILGGSTAFTTREAGEPGHDAEFGTNGGGSLWYKITPQSSGPIRVTTCPPPTPALPQLDTVIAVYTGNAVNALSRIASNTDLGVACGPLFSDLTFNAIAGVTYSIAVDGWNGAQGNFTLNVGYVAQSLLVDPATNMVASGTQGGPFSPSSFQYQLRTSSGSVNYSISGIPNWLTPSTSSGTLTTTPTTVTFTVNANSLTPGSYFATIAFTNTTNGLGNQNHTASLTVNVPSGPAFLARTFVSATGDDNNNCSRTLPCRSFAGAITKTNAGGEINVLDAGGFGAVTIDKPISIVNDGVGAAGILVAPAGTGITINAGPSDKVQLRGLIIEGAGAGLQGIVFNSGMSLTIENSAIHNVTADGIRFKPGASSSLSVSNVVISDTGGSGLNVQPSAGTTTAALRGVEAYNNASWGFVFSGGSATIRGSVADSIASNNQFGFAVSSSGGTTDLLLRRSTAAGNNTGLQATGTGATIRTARSYVTGNATGLSATGGGLILSYQDNYIDDNAGAETPTGNTALK